MSSDTFIGTDIYRSLSQGSIQFGEIIFAPNQPIQIAKLSSGGGCGFSPLISYKILLKNEGGSQSFEEHSLGFDKNTPIKDFIEKNLSVLFEKIN